MEGTQSRAAIGNHTAGTYPILGIAETTDGRKAEVTTLWPLHEIRRGQREHMEAMAETKTCWRVWHKWHREPGTDQD